MRALTSPVSAPAWLASRGKSGSTRVSRRGGPAVSGAGAVGRATARSTFWAGAGGGAAAAAAVVGAGAAGWATGFGGSARAGAGEAGAAATGGGGVAAFAAAGGSGTFGAGGCSTFVSNIFAAASWRASLSFSFSSISPDLVAAAATGAAGAALGLAFAAGWESPWEQAVTRAALASARMIVRANIGMLQGRRPAGYPRQHSVTVNRLTPHLRWPSGSAVVSLTSS